MCITTTTYCRDCGLPNTRRIECEEKCGVWQNEGWGENSSCQRCSDAWRVLAAGPRPAGRLSDDLSLKEAGLVEAQRPVLPQLSLTRSTTEMIDFIKSPLLSPIRLESPSATKQPEFRTLSPNFPFESPTRLSSNQAASASSKIPIRFDRSFDPSQSLSSSPTSFYSAISFPLSESESESKTWASKLPLRQAPGASSSSNPFSNQAASASKIPIRSGPSQSSLPSPTTTFHSASPFSTSASKIPIRSDRSAFSPSQTPFFTPTTPFHSTNPFSTSASSKIPIRSAPSTNPFSSPNSANPCPTSEFESKTKTWASKLPLPQAPEASSPSNQQPITLFSPTTNFHSTNPFSNQATSASKIPIRSDRSLSPSQGSFSPTTAFHSTNPFSNQPASASKIPIRSAPSKNPFFSPNSTNPFSPTESKSKTRTWKLGPPTPGSS